jgi:hypothetical protein
MYVKIAKEFANAKKMHRTKESDTILMSQGV